MFEFIRTHQRLMQLILLLLIVPSFGLIGISGYTTYVSGNHDLVKVDGSAVTQQDFDQARRNQLQQLQQANPSGFDPSSLDNPAARKALLDTLVDRRVLVETASKNHFSVSDAVLRQAIAAIPQLQVNGQFSAERYNEVLKSIGATSKEFEQGRRAEMAIDRVLGPVSMTASVPKPVAASLEQALTDERVLSVHAYAATDYAKDVKVSDQDIKDWYDHNKKELQLPEQVNAQYLLLNEAAAMQGLPAVSTDDLKKYYEQNKKRYITPARVRLSHILVEVPVGATEAQRHTALEQAEKISKEVHADKSRFADIARKQSQDAGTASKGGDLGWITKGSWPAKLEQAVFALKKGEVSGVVDGPGGYHIFLAEDAQPQQTETFEQARAKVESEVRRQLGADRFADMATKLTSLVYDNASSLQPAADALGMKVRSADGIARDRLLPAVEVGPAAASASPDASILDDARVRRALFSGQVLTDKQNSGVIEISSDTMVVVRVAKLVPSQVPELSKVSELIRRRLVAERAQAAAEQAGQAALASYGKQAPAQAPAGFGPMLTVSRIDAKGLGKPLLDAALAVPGKDLPQFKGVKTAQGYSVLYIQKAQPGKPNPSLQASLPVELAQAWGQAEEHAVLEALKAQSEIKVLPQAAKVLAGEAEQNG